MIDKFYSPDVSLDHLRRGPLAAHIDGFADLLSVPGVCDSNRPLENPAGGGFKLLVRPEASGRRGSAGGPNSWVCESPEENSPCFGAATRDRNPAPGTPTPARRGCSSGCQSPRHAD